MEQKSSAPTSLAVEAALSVLKWALIILVINNGLWAAVHFSDSKHPSHNTEISVVQDGTGNTQTISQPHVTSES